MAPTFWLLVKDWALAAAFFISVCMAQMPAIELPWGRYNASIYDSTNKVYTWRNVRFGHNTSQTRFNASKYPMWNFNDIGNGYACPQVDTSAKCADNSNGTFLPFDGNSGEDCLFLDLYVPQSAIKNATNGIFATPVVVWLYGGAFIFGSKDTSLGGPYNNPLYNGTGPLIAAQGNVIMVAGNYRLGAFGWLAGPTMERQGYPNAGLSDQRLLFRWVQDFIWQVGGNKSSVSAWGESAGASSILHHLISRDPDTGRLMPSNFTKVAIQSPAYQWHWDDETLESVYLNYTKLARCPNCSISNLQNMDYQTLALANQYLFDSSKPCTGLFPLGPSIDHKVIRQLTPVALSGVQGVDFHRLDSMIVSHVTNEASTFIPWYMKPSENPTAENFTHFLNDFMPEGSLSNVREQIENQYAASKFNNNQTIRVTALIQDAVFVCNTRHLFDAYFKSSTGYYAMSYDFLDLPDGPNLAVHASDVPAIFWNQWWNASGFIYDEIKTLYPDLSLEYSVVDDLVTYWKTNISIPYQTYWTSLARFGNPNANWSKLFWQPASVATVDGDILVANTLQPYFPADTTESGWRMINDPQNGENNCSFWREIAFKVESILNKQKSHVEFGSFEEQEYNGGEVLQSDNRDEL